MNNSIRYYLSNNLKELYDKLTNVITHVLDDEDIDGFMNVFDTFIDDVYDEAFDNGYNGCKEEFKKKIDEVLL